MESSVELRLKEEFQQATDINWIQVTQGQGKLTAQTLRSLVSKKAEQADGQACLDLLL